MLIKLTTGDARTETWINALEVASVVRNLQTGEMNITLTNGSSFVGLIEADHAGGEEGLVELINAQHRKMRPNW